MSNWVEYTIEFYEKDEAKVKEIVGQWDEREEVNGLVTYVFSQTPSGGFTENNNLCRAGIVFHGSHGEGFDFDRQIFVSDGKELVEIPCNRDNVAVVVFENGEIDKDSLGEAQEYTRVLKNANKTLEARKND